MNNFPENENKVTQETAVEETAVSEQDEISTVFADPTEHKQVKVKKGGKKRLMVVISALVAVAVLAGGTFAVVKLIPKKEEEESTAGIEEIEVLSMEETDYKTVTVKNQNGSFKFYSVITEAEDEDSEDTIEWYMDGYGEELVSSSSISTIVGYLTDISAAREITSKTLADCGLENPAVKADIVTQDDGEFSVLIGSQSPDNSGVYLKLSTDDKIYLISDFIDESLTFTAIDLANTDSFSALALDDSKFSDYLEDGALTTFDSITVSGKNIGSKLVIEPNTDETTTSVISYYVTSSTKRVAENVENILTLFADGVTVSGAYSFDVSNATLKELGLNDPDFAATIKLGSYTYTYKFKLQDDGNYAVIGDDSVMVKMVSADTLECLGYEATDLYADWVYLESITNISNLTLVTSEKTYSFGITANEESESDDDTYIIDYDGADITSSNFQTFYRYCISLSTSEFVTEDLKGEPELTFIYTYNDGRTAKIEFTKATATKYQYSVDGVQMGRINAADFNKIDKYLQQLVSGETVTYN